MKYFIRSEWFDKIKLSYIYAYIFISFILKYEVNISLKFIYFLYNDANIWNFTMDRYFIMNDSSSFSSSSNSLNFILEESSDEAPILDYVLDNKTEIKTL